MSSKIDAAEAAPAQLVDWIAERYGRQSPTQGAVQQGRGYSSSGAAALSITDSGDLARQSFQELLCGDGAHLISPASINHQRNLGQGAYAQVSLCTFKNGQCCDAAPRLVAVKRLKPNLLSSHQKGSGSGLADIGDFLREMQLLQQLQHRCIVDFIGVGASNTSSLEAMCESLFLVQSYCNGGTLKNLVLQQMLHQRRAVYEYVDALRWALDIAKGLEYLHNANPKVIHRDMKLDNILLNRERGGQLQASICDFGLHALAHHTHRVADMRPGPREDSAHSGCQLWRASSVELRGHLLTKVSPTSDEADGSKAGAADACSLYKMTGKTGSLLYMAPEVLLNQPYNEKVDIFSFGVILYELFSKNLMVMAVCQTGYPGEAEHYAYQVAEGFRQPPLKTWPSALSALIQQCQAQRPEDRPCAGEIVERLAMLEASGKIHAMDGTGAVKQGCQCTIM